MLYKRFLYNKDWLLWPYRNLAIHYELVRKSTMLFLLFLLQQKSCKNQGDDKKNE